MTYLNRLRLGALLRALVVLAVASLVLMASAQTPFHGNPKILRPKSGIAPKGYMHTDYLYVNPAYLLPNFGPNDGGLAPSISSNTTITAPYIPANIQLAYNMSSTGGANAIAVVDAYDLSTALADFNAFSSTFGLPTEPSPTVTASTNQVFQVVYASGSQPGSSVPSGWNIEEALDIEWAHSLAPSAKIYLVEANSNSGSDLYAADQVAAALPGVKEVSNSWGSGEFSGETSNDSNWVYPGVCFFFSSGDDAVQEYPSESVNVVSVGGTSLTMTATGYGSESGWDGSGGGPSGYESRPQFQNPVQGDVGSARGDPDVSAIADPDTGVYVYTAGTWYEVGGTSLACPVTAAITNSRETLLNNYASSSQVEEQIIYDNAQGPFWRDITTGGTSNYSCGAGWDYVTGIGTPVGPLAPWSSAQGNPSQNGIGIGSGATKMIRWEFTTGGAIYGQPVVSATNVVYFNSSDGNVYAVDGATGSKLWSVAINCPGSPALDAFGNLFVLASNGDLYSLSASTGATNWTFTEAVGGVTSQSPVVGTGDLVYFGDNTGDVFAVNGQSGTRVWSVGHLTGGSRVSTAALDAYGFVYFLSSGGTLYALDAFNGNSFWSASTAANIDSPVVGPDENVYVGASNDDVYATNIFTGLSAWHFYEGGQINYTPSIGLNGNVLIADNNDDVISLNGVTGSVLWTGSVAQGTATSVASDAAGAAYVADQAGNVLTFNGATGAFNWGLSLQSGVLGAPAVGADGTIYMGSTNGPICAIGTSIVSSIVLTTPEAGATSQTATITLTQAPQETTTINLSSNNSNVTVPSSVQFASGQTQQTFTVNTLDVSTQQTGTISASLNSGTPFTTTLTVNPYPISTFSASPSTIIGGDNSGIVIDLAGPAGPSGDVVSLSSGSSSVMLPATVTIPAGDTTYTHGFATTAVTTQKQVTLTATLNGVQTHTTITLNPFALLKFVTAPSSVTAGQNTGGIIELAGGAGTGGDVISLSSNNSAVIVPSTTTVATGKTESTFTINTSPVLTTTQVTLTASFNGAQLQTTLTLTPGKAKLLVSPASVTGGANSGGVIELPIAVSSSTVVSLSSNNSAATVPANVTVPAVQSSASFQIGTSAVSSPTNVTITATIDNTSLEASLTVEPCGITDFATVPPVDVVGGNSATFKVTLSGMAGSPNGNVISLQSNNSAVPVPTSATVPAGQTSYTFQVTTNPVAVATKVTVTASFNGKNVQTTLYVEP